jgi:hypothetical protein
VGQILPCHTASPYMLQTVMCMASDMVAKHTMQRCCNCSCRHACRVQAGEWLGPWVLCRALEVAVNAARPLGIAAHVLAEPGGGAPTVRTCSPSKVSLVCCVTRTGCLEM